MNKNNNLLRAGVIGTGYLGSFHAEKYSITNLAEFVGIFDAEPTRAEKVADRLKCRSFDSLDKLLNEVDLVSVVTPTVTHYSIARQALEKGVHVLVEKPITTTLKEADELIELAERNNLRLQVGHLERFNAAFQNALPLVKEPLFIESVRIAPYSKRNVDVSVLLDLMIHDIDLALLLGGPSVKSVEAIGGQVFSNSFDIASVRLRFTSGCVADLTASRLSEKVERKLKVFQKNQCLVIDFHEQSNKVYYPGQAPDGEPAIHATTESFPKVDQILLEVESFIQSVMHGTTPVVSGQDGRTALAVALQAMDHIQAQNKYERR